VEAPIIATPRGSKNGFSEDDIITPMINKRDYSIIPDQKIVTFLFAFYLNRHSRTFFIVEIILEKVILAIYYFPIPNTIKIGNCGKLPFVKLTLNNESYLSAFETANGSLQV
jgi:hypothetical protein